MRLRGGRGDARTQADIALPDRLFHLVPRDLPATAQGVAQLYARFGRDIREGTHTVPGFDHALRRHRLIDTIERASRTGVTQALASA
ncbi:hypothetical protein [Nonomuraea sp. NPDC005692]|uniref:hypothetical protein n=1 Tax=Nonomuraea sp. NPDC005692 TaxID=3157168 RepID=UPI003400E282